VVVVTDLGTRPAEHKAAVMLDFANRAERVQATLFREALEALRSARTSRKWTRKLYPVCGDVEFGLPPDKCTICGAPASKYQKIA
jgi:rubrerythrin